MNYCFLCSFWKVRPWALNRKKLCPPRHGAVGNSGKPQSLLCPRLLAGGRLGVRHRCCSRQSRPARCPQRNPPRRRRRRLTARICCVRGMSLRNVTWSVSQWLYEESGIIHAYQGTTHSGRENNWPKLTQQSGGAGTRTGAVPRPSL